MRRFLAAAVIGCLCWASGWAQSSPRLRSGPLCLTPLTAHRNAGSSVLADTGGGTFALAYRSGAGGADSVAVVRLDGSGAILAGPVHLVPPTGRAMVMGLAWNGVALGVLFSQQLGNSQGIFFRLLTPDLTPASGVLRIDEANDSVDTAPGDLPIFTASGGALAWDGSAWGAVWWEEPGHPLGLLPEVVKLARVAANGRSHGPVYEVSDSSGNSYHPAVVWTGSYFGVAFGDDRSGADEIHYRRVATDGSSPSPSVAVTALPIGQLLSGPFVGWNGSETGLAWIDARDGDRAVYFKRLDANGAPLSTETRLSDSSVSVFTTGRVNVTWAGDRWAVASESARSGGPVTVEVYLSFADAAGAKLGLDVLVSSPADDLLSDLPSLAYSGGTLLTAWRDVLGADGEEIYAQALDAAGATTAPRRLLTAGHQPGLGTFLDPQIVTLEAGSYAVAWVDQRGAHDGGVPTLALVDGTGTLQALVEPADSVPAKGYFVALAASADTLAMAWTDAFSQVWLSRLSRAGLELGADTLVSDSYRFPELSLVWSGSAFLVAWVDNRDGNPEVYTAAIAEDGTVLAAANRISNDPQRSRRPALAASGSGALAAWEDSGGTAVEIAVAALDTNGAILAGSTALTADDGAASDRPHLASDGAGYAVAYRDTASGGSQVVLQVLDGSGGLLGVPTELSTCSGFFPRVAWTENRWTVAYSGCRGLYSAAADGSGSLLDAERLLFSAPRLSRRVALAADAEQVVVALTAGLEGDDEALLTSLACATDDTPPSCPSALQAKAVGDALELRWGAGSDADFALGWHYVYRDGRRIVALPPQALGFSDPLPPPGPHTYRVSAVNQGLIESPACPETTLSLTLFYDDFESGDTSAWTETLP